MSNHQLPHDESRVVRSLNDRTAAAAVVENLLRAHPDLTGLVAASDELALGALTAAGSIGREVSVVGYDDSPMAADSLSTIHQPVPEIARRLLQIVALMVSVESIEPIQERIAPRLVVRQSSQAPRQERAAAGGRLIEP
jgi:DNA-binding LacI/PurR family transcriptional regulator